MPQPQLKTIILPADPTPIDQPRPENYTSDNNPVSTLPTPIGNMIGLGGVRAAFDSNTNKSYAMSAGLAVSGVGNVNGVGVNWGTGVSYAISSFTAYAPNNKPFLSTGTTTYQFSGSQNGAIWTSIAAGNTFGGIGEVLTVSIASPILYQYNQLYLGGDGVHPVWIAQLQMTSAGNANGNP